VQNTVEERIPRPRYHIEAHRYVIAVFTVTGSDRAAK